MASIIEGNSKLRDIINLLLDKKIKEIVLVDIRDFNHICDFFVIGTCESFPQKKALMEAIDELLKGEATFIDFYPNSIWSVIDIGDVVVHIFDEESRRFYDIEGLWADALQIKIDERAYEN